MVRRDHIDFGLWRRVSSAHLVVPLDTHVIRVSQCLGLTTYRSPGWPMARQITAALRQIDPTDPVRYDFSLCHIGMQDACGFSRPQRDARCLHVDQQEAEALLGPRVGVGAHEAEDPVGVLRR